MEYLSILLAIGTLILGWFLGIIGNVINDKLKSRSTKEDIRKGIITEISELKIHLSSVSLMAVCEIGNFNMEFFQWIKPYFFNIYESAESIIPKNIRDTLPKLSELDDDDLFNLMKFTFVKNPTSTTPITFTYQNINTPYIDLKIDDISLFNTGVQKSLFKLKRDIYFLNGDINQVWFCHTKTFDNLTPGNFAVLNANINNLHARIARRSKIMVDNIEHTLKLLNEK